jgi:glycosyltransferase 2 family protein
VNIGNSPRHPPWPTRNETLGQRFEPVGITLPLKLRTAGLFDYTPTPTIADVMKVFKKSSQMRHHFFVIGALLGLLLPALVIVLIAATAEEMPRVVSVWPLFAVLGTSVVTWWLQGLIYAVLARPHLKNPGVGDMFRIEMAGLFVALVSPIKGAELPYKACLLRRLGFSAGEGSDVVVTRVLLDAVVLTPAALVPLALSSSTLPEVHNLNLLLAGLATTVVLAVIAFLVRRRARGGAGKRKSRLRGSSWQVKAGAKVSGFLRDMHSSFASYWRPGHRATLLYAVALTTVYWVLRFSVGPLALMAVGWSGDWLPVVVAQLLLASFVLPFAPTPGGWGARELGLAALLSGYVPEGQLLSGLVVYTALSHWLPLIASAFFTSHELRRGIFRRSRGQMAVEREGHTGAITRVLLAVTLTTPPRRFVLSGNPDPVETRTWPHNEASTPTGCIPGDSRA